MASPDAFARRMREMGGNVERNADRLVKQTALAVDQSVVLASPVDTGRFRSNWRVGLGAPVEGGIEAHSPGKDGSTEGANTQGALGRAQAEIAQRRTGQAIWISNTLPYGPRLNNGSSSQAPAGFVEAAVRDGVEVIRRSRLLDD